MKKPERHRLHDHSDDNSGGRIAAQHVSGMPTLTTNITTAGGAANLDDLGDVDLVTTPPVNNDALTFDSATGLWVPEAVTGGSGVIVQDEGTPLATTATTLNFVGSGVTATGAGATKTITIPGSGSATITTKDEGSTLSSTVTTLDFVGAGVVATGAGATTTVTIAGSSTTDPITALFGAADSAFEFSSSSLAGLTAMGSPDVENADTTVPGNYYIKDDTSSTAWQGRYIASPSHPFTAVLKVTGSNMRLNYNGVALFVGTSTPGKMICLDIGTKTRTIGVDIFTNPTTYSTTPIGDVTNAVSYPCYLGLVTVSTTSVSYYFSMDGYVWMPILTAHNGTLTIGSVGFAAKSENANGHAAAFDFFRVWNSSKTFPG